MSDINKWVTGDGGPTIVLQSSAFPFWKGAENFENSLMHGGTLETDYDVICDADQKNIFLVHRYNRDMLVLRSSIWSTCFVLNEMADHVFILQDYGTGIDPHVLVEKVMASPPQATLSFNVLDNILRLIVGAADGDGEPYTKADFTIMPGKKSCDVYESRDAFLIVVRPA